MPCILTHTRAMVLSDVRWLVVAWETHTLALKVLLVTLEAAVGLRARETK